MRGKPSKKPSRAQRSKAESILALLGGIVNYKNRLNDPESDEWNNNQFQTKRYVERSLCRRFEFSSEGDDCIQLEVLNDSLFDEQLKICIERRAEVKNPLSEEEDKYEWCDELVTWNSEMAISRQNGLYALCLRGEIHTPFIFSKYRTSRHPERMYVWFEGYLIQVNLTPRGIIYQLGYFYFDNLRDVVAEALTAKIHRIKRVKMEEHPDCGVWTIWCCSKNSKN